METKDLLSDVFSALHITSNLYFTARLGGRVAVRVPKERRRIRFHLVLRGHCWIGVDGERPVAMSEGDIALVPNGSSQTVSTDMDVVAVPLEDAIEGGALRNGVLHAGDGPGKTLVLCGFCRFDEDIDHPVVKSLPSLIHLRASDLGAEPWTAATLRLLELEANLNAQGTTAVLGRLIEIVVIQATRRLASTQDGGGNGFIAALSHPALSRALNAIHRAPEKPWRVEDLASEAGMSRARFADTFTTLVGVPPIEYLTDWRLIRARALLSDTALGMEDIAERCGYASLPSFSRRFKSRFGMGPGAFRRSRRNNAD